MTVLDVLLIAVLAAFVVIWWARRTPHRGQLLAGLAGLALALGLAGVGEDRWQAGVGAAVAAILLASLLVSRLRRSPPRTGLPWISGPIVVLLAGAGVAALVLFPVWPLPRPDGPYAVGVRSFELADASRPGLIAAPTGTPRRLLVRVWYPAGAPKGARPRRYFSEAEADHTARTLGALVGFPPFFSYVKHVRTHSYEDAPLLPGAKDLPTVFYSHGYTSFLAQNTALMEHLASHGYVVFSVQHTYDSSTTVFPDGDVAPADPALFRLARGEGPDAEASAANQRQAIGGATLDARLDGYLRLREAALAGQGDRLMKSGAIWAADRMFVHDRLQAGAAPGPIREVAAASRLDRVGEMGMSFGGATSGTVCMTDPRCAAGVNLDGADFPFQAFGRDIPTPFLMFHSDMGELARQLGAESGTPAHSFNEFSYESFARAGRRADVYRVQLRASKHLGLSDFSLFVRRPVRDALFGAAPTDVMIGAQNDFVRGFFDRHLRGVQNGFPQAQITAYRDWVSPLGGDDVRSWWEAKTDAGRAAIEARIEAARGD